jgi:pyruvate formate lyase activating enzyme
MRCHAACGQNVHRFENGKHFVFREFCRQCGKCVDACPNSSVYKESGVLRLPTKKMTAQSLLTQILPHLSLCDGVTLSGGEALLQDEAVEFLRLCKESGIHTCVETSGLLESARYAQAVPLVDIWLFGMRVLTANNSDFHTEKLAANARLVRNVTENIIPVIPLVPGVMNRSDVLAQIILALDVIGAAEIQLNPWNRSYDVYYTASGIEPVFPRPSDEAIEQCEAEVRAFFIAKGFNIVRRKN